MDNQENNNQGMRNQQGYQQQNDSDLENENSIAEDMKKLGSEFAKVGGRAIKSGINAGVEAMNNRNTPRKRKTNSGVLFATVCRILGYIMFAIAIILFFSIVMSVPSVPASEDPYGMTAGITGAMSGAAYLIGFVTAISMSTIGMILLAVSHIITLLNISNVKKDQLIDLLIDSNEIAFYQNELIEKK